MRSKSTEDFDAGRADTSWVWMDAFPSTRRSRASRGRGSAPADRGGDQIDSVVRGGGENFFIYFRDAMHVDLCQPCNYETWFDRGWCRPRRPS